MVTYEIILVMKIIKKQVGCIIESGVSTLKTNILNSYSHFFWRRVIGLIKKYICTRRIVLLFYPNVKYLN